MQDLSSQEIKILLSVVRAYDVPVRSDPDPLVAAAQVSSSVNSGLDATGGPREAPVQSYIEARFQVI